MERSKILVVDDDASILRLISIRLEKSGFEVVKAFNGAEALAMAFKDRPLLVITDLRMEGMDGMTLFHRIREQYPSMPVIILTAHGTPSEAAKAKQCGVFDYLTKPFNGRALLDSVREALIEG